jgi:hypothetical protein
MHSFSFRKIITHIFMSDFLSLQLKSAESSQVSYTQELIKSHIKMLFVVYQG